MSLADLIDPRLRFGEEAVSEEPEAGSLPSAGTTYYYSIYNGSHQHRATSAWFKLLPHLDAFANDYLDFVGQSEDLIRRSRLEPAIDEFCRDVDRMISYQPIDLIRARRVSFGNEHEVLYPDSVQELEEALQSRTLVIQALELSDGAIGSLCEMIASRVQARVGASSYLSSPSVDSFGWHVDEWDSAVVQLRGVKAFHFRGRDRELLSPGDVLFFRRGVEHKTETVEHSVHVSITIRS